MLYDPLSCKCPKTVRTAFPARPPPRPGSPRELAAQRLDLAGEPSLGEQIGVGLGQLGGLGRDLALAEAM